MAQAASFTIGPLRRREKPSSKRAGFCQGSSRSWEAAASFISTLAIILTVPLPLEVTPAEVKRRIDAGEKLILLDVREPVEFQTACIAGSQLIPMNSIPSALQSLEAKADESTLIVLCHHGMRSLNVVNWLRQQGVESCQSMSGGIEQWSREIDLSVPRY